jgi:hypothetical protein
VVDGRRGSSRKKNSEPPSPTRRLVLLGASNLSRGLPTLVATARRAWPEPLDIVAAAGRGRSYGQKSRMLGREIVGIVASSLWDEVERRPALPTSALVTDVGNDIMYGSPVDVILGWVAEVLRRLQSQGAETVITALPLGPISTLSPRTYRVLRSLLFPRNTASFDVSRRRVDEVDAGLRRLAVEYGATLFEPPPFWYGFDVIHIRRAHWGAAWKELVDAWHPPRATQRVGVAPWTWIGGQLQPPAERRWFGIRQVRRQPCATFNDGTRLSLY